MSKEKLYDEKGALRLSDALKLAENGDLEAIDAILQDPAGSIYESSIIGAARNGNLVVRDHLYKNVPECWDALWTLAQLHNDLATEYILNNSLREGGLTRAIALAERADPAAKEYIRDFAGLIRFSDNGVPNASSVLYAHKDYNLECRERILRLCRKGK